MTITSSTRARRLLGGLALAALVLGSAGCGSDDSDGGSGGPGGSGADTAEAAYTAFVEAIRDDDADAFDAAVHDGYWSDLTEKQDDNEANLAAHHWAVDNEVMSLPDDPGEVRVGDEALGPHASSNADSYAAQVGELLGVDGLTGDDLALVTVADGYDVGLTNAARDATCAEDDQPIDECLEDSEPTERQDLDVILIRGDDGWKVFGTEPSH